ncbi:MAG: MFS transporter [Myxococcota bacterium]|nr:MFS transporter [Myxococcota bacterium]
MVKTHAEESLGANPGDAALNPADSVAMGVPAARSSEQVASPSKGSFRALRHGAFRLLFISFLINQTGFWISHISLQGMMVELTDNDTFMNGLLFFVLFLPAFILAPISGVAADRFDRKKVMITSYLGVAVACAILALATGGGWITASGLLMVAFAMGVSFTFAGPASMAIAANSVPMEDLPSAIAMQSVANNLTRVVGPLLAAPLVVMGQFQIAFLLYLVSGLTAAALTARMQVAAYEPDSEDAGIFSRIAMGISHARGRYPALPALLTVAMLSSFGVSHTVLLPSFASESLGDGGYFPWIAAATGLGAMVGALRSGRVGAQVTIGRAALGMAAYGLALAAFSVSHVIWPALLAQFVVGFFYFSVMTRLQMLIQKIVDENLRGRVMSLFQVCWAGTIPFGSLAMGYAASVLGTPMTLLASSAICLAYGLLAWVMFGREPAD